MKKAASIFTVLMLLLLMVPVTALADVIWEPYEDDFYENNWEQCDYVGRGYMANGGEGYIAVYESPESGVALDTFANGCEFFVSFTYTASGGVTWGVVEYEKDSSGAPQTVYSGGVTGWVDLADMLVVYDDASFREDHEAEFIYPVQAVVFDAAQYDTVLLWTYPGSGHTAGSISASEENWEPEDYKLEFSYTWTDTDGSVWGYVSYFFGQAGWVCLSDPSNAELPATEIGYEGLVEAADPEDIPEPGAVDAAGAAEDGSVAFLIILVSATVLVTAFIIRALWGKDRKKA